MYGRLAVNNSDVHRFIHRRFAHADMVRWVLGNYPRQDDEVHAELSVAVRLRTQSSSALNHAELAERFAAPADADTLAMPSIT